MAHFVSYNSSDTSTGNTPLTKSGGAKPEIVLGPIQTDTAESITGSIYTDQAGTLFIEQSFDAGEHYDISAEYSIVANKGVGFKEAILAPVTQVRFKNTASTDQTVIRLFARTFTQGR